MKKNYKKKNKKNLEHSTNEKEQPPHKKEKKKKMHTTNKLLPTKLSLKRKHSKNQKTNKISQHPHQNLQRHLRLPRTQQKKKVKQ